MGWDGSGFLQAGDLANDQLSESEIAADCQLMLIGETFLDAPCKGQDVALVLCRSHMCRKQVFLELESVCIRLVRLQL